MVCKMDMPSNRMKYNSKFKLKVVAFFKDHKQLAATREIGVSEKLVHE